jgi:DNA-binding response OmpR family regulator
MPASTASADGPRALCRVLSISADRSDHNALRGLISGAACQIVTAGTCHAGLRRLNAGRISIVICERDLPDGSWREILDYTSACSERPALIVTSPLADERFWAEVLNLGGFDVLAKPFNPQEVRHVLQTARLRGTRAVSSPSAAATT